MQEKEYFMKFIEEKGALIFFPEGHIDSNNADAGFERSCNMIHRIWLILIDPFDNWTRSPFEKKVISGRKILHISCPLIISAKLAVKELLFTTFWIASTISRPM